MHRFLAAEIIGKNIILDQEESKHLSKVLRLKTDDKVEVTDGLGKLFQCIVIDTNPKDATLKVLYTLEDKKEDFLVEIAAVPTKNINRWEWFLEKSTEIGINAIHPLKSERAIRKVLKHDRQIKILKGAMKQSYKLQLPALNELQEFRDFIKKDFEGKKYIAHCYPTEKAPLNQHPKGEKALILIGPEGDFSEEEIELAQKNGFKPVSLGKSRLRTETAAIVACHTINLINA